LGEFLKDFLYKKQVVLGGDLMWPRFEKELEKPPDYFFWHIKLSR
jgi:hypothetical protein